MTPRAALDELIQRIEAVELDPSDADEDRTEIVISALGDENHSLFFAAWDGDVSRAVALVSSLLPGAMINLHGPYLGKWDCAVSRERPVSGYGQNPDPARALLLAGLRAYRDTLGEVE